jgi:dipeptidyl-peptidase-4
VIVAMRIGSMLTIALAAVALTEAAHAQRGDGAGDRLTIERVASLPSLTGTSPASPTWSPDSRWLAFRWNEAGWPFRDVYVVRADGTGRRRLTDMQRTDPAPDPPAGNSTDALAARAAARARGGVSEIAWGADSRHLLVVSRGRLFRVPLEGGAPMPLPAGEVSDIAVSPDGSTLAFLRDGDLWRWRLDGSREPERLTTIAVPGIGRVPLGTYNRAEVEVGTGVWGADWPPFAWSPDGRTIAFHLVDRRHIRKVPFPFYLGDETTVNELRRGYPGDENERRSLALIDMETRFVQPIPLPEPGARGVSDYQWSPQGQLLVDHVSDTGAERWLYVVHGTSGEPRLVWHDRRETRIYPAYVARWLPGGTRILFVADLGERDHLYTLDLDPALVERHPVAFTAGDWDVAGERGAASVRIGPDGAAVFTATLKNPYERQVYRQSGETAIPAPITSRPGVHVPTLSPDGRHLASLWSDDVTPPELLVVEARPGAQETRVTTSPPAEFDRHAWVRPRYATFRNAVDGFAVHARIIEPASLDRSRRHPVIFSGVYSNTVRNRWGGLTGTLNQYLVQQGYIVVQVDVRGSVGYGRAFREAFLMDYGGRDLDDLQAVADGLRKLPYVDGTRMGIWGSSYGGLLTVYALLKRPGLFAAGVAGAPAVDPHAFGPDDVAITRSPLTHPEAFVRGSALGLGENLRDHLLIIHGLMDDVVPFRTTMALAERLMLLGKDFDVATAPAATHAWSAREHHAVYFYRKLVQYFDRYLR